MMRYVLPGSKKTPGPVIKVNDLESVISVFLGTIGGATTFASSKVRNVIGRIGIFAFKFILFE